MFKIIASLFVILFFLSCASPEQPLVLTVSSNASEENISEEMVWELEEGMDESLEEESVMDSVEGYSEKEIIEILSDLSERYDVPLWFLEAIVHRESSYNTTLINYDDTAAGEENWNSKKEECVFTDDGYPHGIGLTQLTGWMYQGSPYPYCFDEAEEENKEYFYSMRKQDFGEWISMKDVSVLEDPFDPRQNVERFLTGYAVPFYAYLVEKYPDESEAEIWRRVAFHWNKGLYVEYDPENEDYLVLYDRYVEEYTS